MSDGSFNPNTISSFPWPSRAEIEKAFEDFDPEYRELALNEQNIVANNINEVKKVLSQTIYYSQKEELIKPLKTQLNLRLPQSLKNSNPETETIKKDLLFYKKAYEIEAANINKIIVSTNVLNNQLITPLKAIKETLKLYIEDYINKIKDISIPLKNKKEGIDNINVDKNNEKQFKENVKEINNEMDSYQDKSIKFLQEYTSLNKELSSDIINFIQSYGELKDSVVTLKKEMSEGFTIFENCTPEFENLEDKERIKMAMSSILAPLSKITKLISESENKLEKAQSDKNEKMPTSGLANKMKKICDELNKKAKIITDKINQARLKINLQEIKANEFNLEPPNINEIEDNINKMKNKIEETDKNNSKIKNEIMKKIEDDINISRLDILFIIDCTNSNNTYLDDIKTNFNRMISEIYKSCPTSTIYIGLIGYRDIGDLELGDEYIDIDFTQNKEEIYKQIENLEFFGGGDEAEDLAGAFDMALKKQWKGFSRFAILATDAPCHGIEFHSKEVEDNFPEGDPYHRDIKASAKEFANKGISLFCGKFFNKDFIDTTEQMFEILKKKYDEGKPKCSIIEFTVQECEDLCETIIRKASNIYITRKI